MMSACGVCGTEKKYDHNRNRYKRCGPCNTKSVMKIYNNNRELYLEKNKTYYQNNTEYFREYHKKRKIKISNLQKQIKELTEMLQSVTVS